MYKDHWLFVQHPFLRKIHPAYTGPRGDEDEKELRRWDALQWEAFCHATAFLDDVAKACLGTDALPGYDPPHSLRRRAEALGASFASDQCMTLEDRDPCAHLALESMRVRNSSCIGRSAVRQAALHPVLMFLAPSMSHRAAWDLCRSARLVGSGALGNRLPLQSSWTS
jgi:hypothetical protein